MADLLDPKVGPVKECSFSERYLFLLTNTVFFIPAVLKLNFQTIWIFSLGLVSLVFHTKQCCQSQWTEEGEESTHHCMMFDIYFSALTGLMLSMLNWEKITGFLILLFIIAIAIYSIPSTSSHVYVSKHSIWHLLCGGIFINLTI